jgi:hypothetical protein
MLEFRPIGRFSAYDKVILAGALAMAMGTLLPIVRIPFLGTLNYLARGQGDGTIVLLLSGVVIAAVFYGYRRIAALVGFVALVLMAVTLLNIVNMLAELHKETAQNPFGALLADTVGLEWGWLPLIGGALAVIGAGVTSGKEMGKIGGDQADGSEQSRSWFGLDQKSDDGWTLNINEKIAQHVRETAPQKPIPRAFGKRV